MRPRTPKFALCNVLLQVSIVPCVCVVLMMYVKCVCIWDKVDCIKCLCNVDMKYAYGRLCVYSPHNIHVLCNHLCTYNRSATAADIKTPNRYWCS